MLRVDNYIISTPIYDIILNLRSQLTNGKLREVRKSSSWISVTCPSHSDGHESKNSCYVNEKNGGWNCFSCGEHGNFVYFVAKCFDSSIEFAKSWLIDNYGSLAENAISLGDDLALPDDRKRIRFVSDSSILDSYQSYCPYLQKRGISRETCELLSIKYDPKYRQVIFPCFNSEGDLIMLARRRIDTKQFFMDAETEKPIYCFDKISRNKLSKAMLVEGPFDCATCYENNVPAIAMLGAPSSIQIDSINNSCISILYLATDNDEAGYKFRNFIKNKLSKRIMTIDVELPPGRKDVNELSKEEWEALIVKYNLPIFEKII